MDEGAFTELWEAAKLAGPFGTLLMMVVAYYINSERKRLMNGREDLLERVLTAMNASNEAIKENTKAILFIDRRGSA